RERFALGYGDPTQTSTAYRFAPAGRATRRVVAVHGAGNDALFGWIGLFKRLLDRGSEILTFDLPGPGRLDQGRFSPDAARAALSAAVAEIGRGRRRLPTHAIGVSVGGSVLLGTLPALREELHSAAAIVAPLRIELTLGSFVGELRPRTFATVVREREHYGRTGLVPSFGPFKRDTYPLRLERSAPRGAFGYVEVLNQCLA